MEKYGLTYIKEDVMEELEREFNELFKDLDEDD